MPRLRAWLGPRFSSVETTRIRSSPWPASSAADAVASAEESVELADRSGDDAWRKANQTALADEFLDVALRLPRRGTVQLFGGLARGAAGLLVEATSAVTHLGRFVQVLLQTFGADLAKRGSFRPLRPPGSVPEREFLAMCIRCGQCFKVCPNNVLQPLAFQQGFEGLWTPHVVADWAGCESSCNGCGQVCPTGAIRALSIDEKRVARIAVHTGHATTVPFLTPRRGRPRAASSVSTDYSSAAGR